MLTYGSFRGTLQSARGSECRATLPAQTWYLVSDLRSQQPGPRAILLMPKVRE